MGSWLRFIFGLEDGEMPAGSEASWEFSSLPQGTWLLAAAVLVAACVGFIVILYRSERSLSVVQKLVLSALRLGALAVVVLMLLNPRLLTEIRLEREGRAMLYIDASASMAEADLFEGEDREEVEAATGLDLGSQPSRAQLVTGALSAQRIRAALEERNDVEMFTFGGDVEPLRPNEDGTVVVAATRAKTSLAAPLRAVLEDAERQPVAGVVIVSDGRSTTQGEDPVELARQVKLQRGASVHTVGVGRARVPENYAVVDLEAPRSVEIGYPVEIEGRVVLSGIPGPVDVTLEREARDGRATVVDVPRRIEAGQYFEGRLKFIDTLRTQGTFKYTLRIAEHERETRRRDNARHVFVRASEQEYRVLLVSGNSLPEFRFLRNFAIRDDNILVSSWQATADPQFLQDGDVPIQAVPTTPQALDEYDVVILVDPSPDTLTGAFQHALTEFVAEQGGGLAFVASETHTPDIADAGAYGDLLKLVPVELDGRGSVLTTREGIWEQPWVPQLSASGIDHALCRLHDEDDENLRVWRDLPPLYYVHPSTALRPAAIALATGRGQVLLAVQRVGLGQSAYLGSDELWRWRGAGVAFHERFWAGAIRFLAMGKKSAGSGKVTLETDREGYRDGDRVRITLQFADSEAATVTTERVDVTLARIADEESLGREIDEDAQPIGESTEVALLADATRPGRFTGVIRPEETGAFRLDYSDRGHTTFQIRSVTAELEDPSPDFAALESIAVAGGGTFVDLTGLDRIPEEIPSATVTEVLGRRAATVWDSAFWMILFSILLGIEWTLRKWWRLC